MRYINLSIILQQQDVDELHSHLENDSIVRYFFTAYFFSRAYQHQDQAKPNLLSVVCRHPHTRVPANLKRFIPCWKRRHLTIDHNEYNATDSCYFKLMIIPNIHLALSLASSIKSARRKITVLNLNIDFGYITPAFFLCLPRECTFIILALEISGIKILLRDNSRFFSVRLQCCIFYELECFVEGFC